MKIFSYLYNKVLMWSKHPHAPYYLCGVSFAEASFFPVPPDFMLISMGVAEPKRSWYFATIALIGSILGGILGYIIGAFFFYLVQPYIDYFGYAAAFEQFKVWFNEWGFWIIFLAGFSPIPYKIFTIGAGVVNMAFFPFVIASIIARGGRFYLVSMALYWGGERIQKLLHRYIDYLGWLVVVLLVCIYFLIKFEIF